MEWTSGKSARGGCGSEQVATWAARAAAHGQPPGDSEMVTLRVEETGVFVHQLLPLICQ